MRSGRPLYLLGSASALGSAAACFCFGLKSPNIASPSSEVVNPPRSLHERRVPFDHPPFGNETVRHERIAADEFFCRLARRKDAERAFGRIAERPRRHQQTARMKLIEPCAMSGIV